MNIENINNIIRNDIVLSIYNDWYLYHKSRNYAVINILNKTYYITQTGLFIKECVEENINGY
jgi:hypothetical protein